MSSVLTAISWPLIQELHLLPTDMVRRIQAVSKSWKYTGMALEGEGTWQTWVRDDPRRVLALKRAATSRLALQFGELSVEGTDSHDSPDQRLDRDAATRLRVFCGLQGWYGYTTYRRDIEGAATDSEESIICTLRLAKLFRRQPFDH